MPHLTLEDVARITGGRLAGDGSREVAGAKPPADAGPADVTFAFSAKDVAAVVASSAGAAVVPEGVPLPGRDVVHHGNPQVAMAAVLAALHPPTPPAAGVDPTATVHPEARVGAGVHVGAFAVVERGAELHDGAVVGAGCHVGARSVVGERTRLHPRVVLYEDVRLGRDCIVHSGVIVGADGFGFVRSGARNVKIPQVAGVEIGDDVEIGANSCVDRGTMTPTRIGTNTKIDNLVQIGHNCDIGRRVIICGQSAIAGSTVIEDDVVLGGQVGAAGHLTIGRGTMAAGATGITSDVAPGSRIAGTPPMTIQEWRRVHAVLRHLPEMRSALRRLQKDAAESSASSDGA